MLNNSACHAALFKRGTSALALISASLLSAPAFAQTQATTPAAQPAEAAATTGESDADIVVFARRRSETVVNAPLAITALSPEKLKEQSITTFTDLGRVAPNVTLRQTNGGGGTVAAIIRGQVIAQANIANDSPIGFYYDDVILAQPKGATAGLFDIASVEVSRGVQGTLKGRNNTGGAINVYFNKPKLGEFSGEAMGAYGSRNYVQLNGIVNVPVGDKIAIRVGGQRTTQDAQGHSVINGQGYGGRHEYIARGSVLFEPADGTSLQLTYERTDINQNPTGRRMIPGSITYNSLIAGTRNAQNPSGLQFTDAVLRPANFFDGSTGYLMANDKAKINFYRANFSTEINDTTTFKVIGGYRQFNASGGIDLEGSPATQLDSVNGGTSHQFTIEPQLSGSFADDKINYVLGYYHFSDKGKLVADTFAYSVNAAAPTNPFRNWLRIREGATNLADAGYAHVEWKATDQLEIAGGLRYTKDQRAVRPDRVLVNSNPTGSTYALFQAGTINAVGCQFTTPTNGVLRPAGGFVLVGGNAVASGECPDIELTKNYGYWSYEASARYKFSDRVSLYARTGLGQKSGGLNIPVVSTGVAPYNPEKVTDYEAGIKGGRVLDGMLDFSLAVYYSDYKNLQRYLSNLLPGGVGLSNVIINAGSARVWGIEGDFNARLVAGFSVNGFFGYTNAKYKTFTTTDATGNPLDLSGQPFLYTPKFSSRLGAQYETSIADGTFRIGGGWNHTSNASLSVIAFPGANTGKVDLVDARASWETPDKRFEFAVFGTNLTNKKYFTDVGINRAGVSTALTAVTGAYGVQNQPRMIAASVTARFGN